MENLSLARSAPLRGAPRPKRPLRGRKKHNARQHLNRAIINNTNAIIIITVTITIIAS